MKPIPCNRFWFYCLAVGLGLLASWMLASVLGLTVRAKNVTLAANEKPVVQIYGVANIISAELRSNDAYSIRSNDASSIVITCDLQRRRP